MRVPETRERAVRIMLLVRMCMMLDVRGRPRDGRSFKRHASEDEQQYSERKNRLKTVVGEHAMVSHRDPQARRHPKEQKENDVEGKDSAIPEENHRRDHSQQWDNDEEEDSQPVERTLWESHLFQTAAS